MPLLAITLILIFSASAVADDSAITPCTQREERQALETVDALKNWHQVYRSYKRYSQCDDGAIAEGYSDVVAKLLANDWKHFDQLIALSNSDKQFRKFVLNHINTTADDRDLLKLSRNAQSNCPVRGQELCRLIVSAAAPR